MVLTQLPAGPSALSSHPPLVSLYLLHVCPKLRTPWLQCKDPTGPDFSSFLNFTSRQMFLQAMWSILQPPLLDRVCPKENRSNPEPRLTFPAVGSNPSLLLIASDGRILAVTQGWVPPPSEGRCKSLRSLPSSRVEREIKLTPSQKRCPDDGTRPTICKKYHLRPWPVWLSTAK